MEAEFCVEALNEAIHKFGPPEVMSTDKGSQFISFARTDRLRRPGVRISMDHKCRFLDNIFVGWLWRSMKYECVHLNVWETGSEANEEIRKWMEFYNHKRPHSAIASRSPAVACWEKSETKHDQRVAQKPLDSVQTLGSSSNRTFCALRINALAAPNGDAGIFREEALQLRNSLRSLTRQVKLVDDLEEKSALALFVALALVRFTHRHTLLVPLPLELALKFLPSRRSV